MSINCHVCTCAKWRSRLRLREDWYVFCRVVRMGSEREFCTICRENVLAKFSSCAASVSLFLETSNKKFSRVSGGKQVVLGKLLQSIGVFAVPGLSWTCLQEIHSNGCKLLMNTSRAWYSGYSRNCELSRLLGGKSFCRPQNSWEDCDGNNWWES